jgi:hypothetical protein
MSKKPGQMPGLLLLSIFTSRRQFWEKNRLGNDCLITRMGNRAYDLVSWVRYVNNHTRSS